MKTVYVPDGYNGSQVMLNRRNKMEISMNTREKMSAIVEWLGWQDETLSEGLISISDAEKLYDHWRANQNLPEMADEWFDDEGNKLSDVRKSILGYDPMDWVYIE